MTTEPPAMPASWGSAMNAFSAHAGPLHGWLLGWFETHSNGVLSLSNKGASNLASAGSLCFLLGRFSGAGLLRRFCAH
jgi:FHS family L-fucose permease-like MFS transporter